jgi:hypothetical protein
MLPVLVTGSLAADTTFLGNWSLYKNGPVEIGNFGSFQIGMTPSMSSFAINVSFPLYAAYCRLRPSRKSTTGMFSQLTFDLLGFFNPDNNSYFFFAFQGVADRQSFVQFVGDTLANFDDFYSRSAEIRDTLVNESSNGLPVMSFGFITPPIEEPLDSPYDLPWMLVGNLHIGSRELKVLARCFDLISYYMNGKVFGVLNAVYIAISFYAWGSVALSPSPALLNALSVQSFILHTGFEFNYGLLLLNFGMGVRAFSRLYFVLFVCIIAISFHIQMNLVANIWRVVNDIGNLEMAQVRVMLVKHLVEIAVLVAGCFLFFLHMLEFPVIPLLFLYSTSVPQIVRSVTTGQRKTGDSIFVMLTTINRLFILWYFFGCKWSIGSGDSILMAIVITLYSLLQMIILLLQNKWGVDWFLPRKYRSAGFDYTATPVQPGAECSICMSPITEDEEGMMTPCGRGFHRECLSRWMQEEMICPVCRERLPQPFL